MDLDKVNEQLTETLRVILEANVKKLRTSFKSLKDYLPKGWYDLTTNISPFGNTWGRGIVSEDGTVIITMAGTKHAVIKQRLESETNMTFYWGYVIQNKTLYLETGSIKGNGFNKNNVPIIASAILDRLKNLKWQVTPKNVIYERWEGIDKILKG